MTNYFVGVKYEKVSELDQIIRKLYEQWHTILIAQIVLQPFQ